MICEKQVHLAVQQTLGNTDIKRIMLCIAHISSPVCHLAPFPKHMCIEGPCQGWQRQTKRGKSSGKGQDLGQKLALPCSESLPECSVTPSG